MEAENFVDKSSVIRQKGESQNGGNKKSKHAKFSEKRTFLTPWYAHVSITEHIWMTVALTFLLKETRNSSKIQPLYFEKKWYLNSEKCFVKYQWTHVLLNISVMLFC